MDQGRYKLWYLTCKENFIVYTWILNDRFLCVYENEVFRFKSYNLCKDILT